MQGLHYSIRGDKTYFLTSTVVDWVDVFTRKNHKIAIINSIKHCQEKKGLNIFAWCLMPSHLHILANTDDGFDLADVMRDFKKFTSKKIIKQIEEEPESRREWMLSRFEYAGKYNAKIKNYKFWQEGNHAIEVYSPEVTWEKINYIHNNPVEEMYVTNAEDYLFSSARDYQGVEGLLKVELIMPFLITV